MSTPTGALVPGWQDGSLDLTWSAFASGGRPWTVRVSPTTGSLLVGGNFASLGGQPRSNLGSVDLATGSVTGGTPAAVCATC